ncbi:hypothetical protein P8452_14552 [Trifolium repens]|nr:hypothetical protein P8452_14552 [Trifolium repens]
MTVSLLSFLPLRRFYCSSQVQVENSLFCLQVLSFYEGSGASYGLYRKLNISIIKNGVIHKVSWVKYRQHVLNSTAAIADVILIREESLKELSLIVNGAAAETLILSTEVAMTKPCDLQNQHQWRVKKDISIVSSHGVKYDLNSRAEFLWFHGLISNSAFCHFWFKYKSQERW